MSQSVSHSDFSRKILQSVVVPSASQPVSRSVVPVSRSVIRSASQTACLLASQPTGSLVSPSFTMRTISLPVGWLVTQSVIRSVNRSVGQPVSQLVLQSVISQSVGRSASQLECQSFSQ